MLQLSVKTNYDGNIVYVYFIVMEKIVDQSLRANSRKFTIDFHCNSCKVLYFCVVFSLI